MKRLSLIMASLASAFLICACGDGPNAGITTIGNTVAMTVVDQKGEGVNNVEVALLRTDYNPADDPDRSGYLKLTTDSRGQCAFKNVPAGTYNVEGHVEGLAVFVPGLSIQKDEGLRQIPALKMDRPGAVRVLFDELEAKLNGHLFIPGTTRHRLIDSGSLAEGSLLMEYVAAARYASMRYRDPGDTVDMELTDTTGLQVDAGETTVLNPFLTWKQALKLSINTTTSGADVAESLNGFPMLVRLNGDNFDFTNVRPDGGDIRFSKPDGTPLAYQVDHWDREGKTAAVWVKIDTLEGNSASQYVMLYAGKPRAASRSNGPSVFPAAAGNVAVWHLGGTGVHANSAEGGLPATPFNFDGDESRTGMVGLADSLDGATPGDYLDIGNGYNDFGAGLTYSVWVYPTGKGNWERLLDLGNGQARDNIILQRQAMSSGLSLDNYNGTTKTNTLLAPAALVQDTWQHITLTVTGKSASIYRNGVLMASDTISQPLSGANRTMNFIGKSNWAADPTFMGMLDEARLAKVVRSTDWIKLEYANQKPDQNVITVTRIRP